MTIEHSEFRISVDTGGTFTDLVVVGGDGELHLAKALTTYDRAFDAIAVALAEVAERLGLSVGSLLTRTSQFSYGTTRSTNAVVEGRTAPTAFFTTEGFPDILLLREGGKRGPFRQMEFPPPYVPRHRTFEIAERVDSEGTIHRPLDERSARAAIEAALAQGCEAIGVCLLWSIADPAHEHRVGELIEAHAPGLPYTLSHELNPIVREYRRASSTVIDASLKPLMQAFLTQLDTDLRDAGFSGNLLISTSFGGSWPIEEMIERPIYSIGSGPSMAPVAALAYAEIELQEMGGTPDLLVCDTGGTTFDVGLVREGRITTTAETWLGERWTGHITGTPAVDIKSIGAGGGSIAWIDPGGLLRIGPSSAGSDPGPACYGNGGGEPTVTDAAAMLGYLDDASFLGGRLRLDAAAADAAFQPLAERLGMSVPDVAHAALTIAGDNIAAAIREITVAQGIDPRGVALVAGGGASGLAVVAIARELGCSRVLLPRTAGALSACGALQAELVDEFTVNCYGETHRLDLNAVNDALGEAESRAEEFLRRLARLDLAETGLSYAVAARYRQQVWELDTPLPGPRLRSDADVRLLEKAFDELHERTFAVKEPGQYLECLAWKVRATARLGEAELASRPDPGVAPEPISRGVASFAGHGFLETPRYAGPDLVPGTSLDGPAIIVEPTTTLVVDPGARVTTTSHGNYLIEPDTDRGGRESQTALEVSAQ